MEAVGPIVRCWAPLPLVVTCSGRSVFIYLSYVDYGFIPGLGLVCLSMMEMVTRWTWYGPQPSVMI